MVVENLKLHSNYLHPNSSFGNARIEKGNKLSPNDSLIVSNMFSHDMCFVKNNKVLDKTIATNKSNGFSFKGRYNMLYKVARAVVDENMPNRAWFLVRKARFERVAKAAQKEHPFLYKAVTNEKFLKAMKFMNDNALLSDAAIALFYTCVMRPVSIAALPTKDANEKKKNTYQIGHSISTGIIGFLTAFAIQTPIKDAINKITDAVSTKNAEKYINKSSKYLFKKENIEKVRTLMERSHQPISLPLKAALTIFLVPRILKVFGLSKVQKPKGDEKNVLPYDSFRYFAAFKGAKNSAFQSFAGGLKNESK